MVYINIFCFMAFIAVLGFLYKKAKTNESCGISFIILCIVFIYRLYFDTSNNWIYYDVAKYWFICFISVFIIIDFSDARLKTGHEEFCSNDCSKDKAFNPFTLERKFWSKKLGTKSDLK